MNDFLSNEINSEDLLDFHIEELSDNDLIETTGYENTVESYLTSEVATKTLSEAFSCV